MTASPQRTPMVTVQYSKSELDEASVLPWFSYQVSQPSDLPPVSARPPLRTSRLLIRAFVREDAEALHKLRADAELQQHSIVRGRPDESLEQTIHNIEQLLPPYDDCHWYFGAFLAETGELIGEGGLPDIHGRTTRSGWPEADFLIARDYQRQGYGTELFEAVMTSWWNLPRERRRRQLHPYVIPNHVPGAKLADCVVICHEAANKPAAAFFGKMAGEDEAALQGTFEDYDMREGRQQALTQWSGMTLANPILFVDPDEGSGDEE
ncbi:acyl-CoA N-acyltransferase [Microdochium trichocladiopsis]|uniref:Acyl-CoA N-acyltransferase n=1 Tax=Microdochium trichocladiopsis TaxID=1682393 RepID=A0A9P9BXH8_9PEZI|nr:acyl-CoA N-acyltransferase [Microdochium trichocladiopsis]KAH7037063.1 acyl-CoA N-acyltransferase [Microdochium trichocladiopsis]